jgi:hypothetical protein
VSSELQQQRSDRERKSTIMGFSKFMASTAGRPIRVLAGVALIVVGGILGGGWWALAVVGLVPLAAGALDICLFNVLFGQPLSGKVVRAG